MLETFLKLVSQCPEEDIEVLVDHDKNKEDIIFLLTVYDFAGFDENWDEVMNDLSEETENLLDWLKECCPSAFENYCLYPKCVFSNFTVDIEYTSSDI